MSLQVRDLSVGYHHGIDVLRDVALTASKGRITAVIGPNGAGKSTLFKVVIGLLQPWSGTVSYDGVDITGVETHQLAERGITYIPQRRSVFPSLTVRENLELGGWMLRSRSNRLQQRIADIFARFPDLRERQDQKSGLLSGGQQRMLELARAMISEPSLMLIDEPSFGLAPRIAREVYAKIRELNTAGISILLIDQNIREAIKLADYIYLLEYGRNKEEGPKPEFENRMAQLIESWLRLA